MKGIPGFVDLQVNGFLGVDFSAPDLTEPDFIRACRELLGRGTAAFLPTVITSPMEAYEHNLPMMADVLDRPEFAGRLPGLHLEGPFVSPEPGAVGAHNPEWAQPPSAKLFDQLCELAGGKIKLLTLAADVPGAAELTRHAVGRGVRVSLGHHLATQEDLERLAQAGATALTHLGNALPNMIHRHINPIWAGLAADDLAAMLIADGHHLPPALLKTAIRTKGVDKIIVVSDASPLAGMPPGRYTTMANDVVLEESGLLHNPAKGCMVGSSATMRQCMDYLASLNILPQDDLRRVGFYNPLRLIGADPSSILVLDPPQSSS
ncbi:MAG: amidohydrolase family protein, partial [Planctomycetes bacterium]|nr:amidohydrolase family protein [Planctomycetota bacterium]